MRIARVVQGMIAVALGFSAAACGGATAYQGEGAKVPLAPAGVFVDEDVAAGFGAYEATLARWGRWSPDARYGVQWCPNRDQVAGYGLPFEPYRTGGHWGAIAAKPAYGAPPGAPYWISDDSETWGDITMHHGYWVQRVVDPTGGARARDWCWIPGAQETAARVVWRSGGGFVGWAPEPPSWVDDGEEGLFADFAWSFVMTGALLETFLPDQILADDAAEIAASATTPSRMLHGNPLVRVGPAASTVAAAKRELAAYIRAHPEIPAASTSEIAHASARAVGGSNASNGSAGASGSTGGSGTSGSSNAGPDAKTKARHATDDDRMPQASLLADVMMRDPMIGPIGITPRFVRSVQRLNPAIDDSFDASYGTGRSYGSEGSSSSSSSSSNAGSGHSGVGSFVSSVAHVASGGGSSSSSSHSSSYSSSPSHSSAASHSSSSSSSSSSTSSHASARAPR